MSEPVSYPNGRCCVFQPFDNGDFDKRFEDILVPAIVAAGMEPYRVDRDLGAVIPVETLHQEIKSAVVCVADITTRNPNVMYELGYAIAADKDVIIISGPSGEKYPFDIQHRGILPYQVGSSSDFKRLEEALTAKLKSTLDRQRKTTAITTAPLVRSSHGLQPHELTALALLLANSDSVDDVVGANWLKQEMRKAGITEAGTRLAMARLKKLGYTNIEWRSQYEETYVVYLLTEAGEEWLLENQSLLVLQTNQLGDEASKASKKEFRTDEEIPF